MAKAILSAKSVNVNTSIITESLSINDILESIDCLTRYIISRKRKKYMSKLLEQIKGRELEKDIEKNLKELGFQINIYEHARYKK